MKKFLLKAIILSLTLAVLSGCVSRNSEQKADEEKENNTHNEVQMENEEKPSADASEDKDADEDDEKEKEDEDEKEAEYQIRETGFGIKMLDGWKISSLPAPMGLIVRKNDDMNNAAMISIMYGEEKAQMEKDFEGNFAAIEADEEIQNYFCDQTAIGDFYRIVLDYESFSEETGTSSLTRVVYQETKDDGLIIASFQFKPDQKTDVKAISESIQPISSDNVLKPDEIEQLG